MTDISLTPLMVGLVPVVIALVQLVKMYLDSRWSPLVALVLGVAGAILITQGFTTGAVLQGILVGLSAAGLFTGVRATFS